MHAHPRGAELPDPTHSPGGEGLPVTVTPGDSTVTVAGIGFNGPAFTAAEKTCHFGPGSRAPITEAQKQGMLKSARCMRSHGVPNFPDSTFSGTGVRVGEKELNPQTPAFQRAVRRCRGTKPLRVVAGG